MRLIGMFLIALFIFLLGTNSSAQNFEPVGGPYSPDSTTVLLLHFDGNFNNSSRFSKNAIAHGNYQFLPSFDPNLG